MLNLCALFPGYMLRYDYRKNRERGFKMKLERQIKKWTIGLTMVIMMFILAAGAVKVEAKSRTKTQPILNHAQVIAYPAMKTTVLKVKNLK